MNTFTRFFKHLITTSAAGKRAFPQDVLHAIEQEIHRGESRHRAEIRLIVEPAFPVGAVLRRRTSRQRAIALFAQYGVWDTEENCGVLVYVNLADRKVEIVTDRGIGKKVKPDDWHAICNDMARGFGKGAFLESSLVALGRINALLEQHFPGTGSRPNQLSNRPLVL